MLAIYGKSFKAQFWRFPTVSLLCVGLLATMAFGCTVKHPPVPAGVIPTYSEPTPRAQAFGKKLFDELDENYDVENSHQRYGQLRKILNRLLLSVGADPGQWQLCLFDKADLVDVRAVHGNYIFVWSGFLDFAENEDEVAAILACEIAHVLADHTIPVEFNMVSRFLFGTAEIATSVGLLLLSQGTIAVGGQGWMQYAYAEAADLDPLDRQYDEEEEREALAIACLILERSQYRSQAMLGFWKRAQETRDKKERDLRLDRSVSLGKRLVMLDEMLPPDTPAEQMAGEQVDDGLTDLALQEAAHGDVVESSLGQITDQEADCRILAPL
jgi:predicted Zn-dependent protease